MNHFSPVIPEELLESRAHYETEQQIEDEAARWESLVDSERMHELVEAHLASTESSDIREWYAHLLVVVLRAHGSLNAIAHGSPCGALSSFHLNAFRNLIRVSRQFHTELEPAIEEELRA